MRLQAERRVTGDWFEILSLAAALLAVGAVAGLIAGLLGVGGGIVIVPALYYMLRGLGYGPEHVMHVCVATSLATIVFTSVRSVMSHAKRGAVDWDMLRDWAPYIVASAVVGVALAGVMNTRALLAVFGGLAFAVALHMAFGFLLQRRRAARGAPEPASGPLGDAPPTGWAMRLWASFVGFFSTLMGVGGGTLGVTIMTLYATPIHKAVATAAGLGVLIAAPSTLGFLLTGHGLEGKPPFTLGYVNLAAFAIIVPMTVAFAPLGARLAHALDPRPLRLVFAFFLAVTALNMLRKAGLG